MPGGGQTRPANCPDGLTYVLRNAARLGSPPNLTFAFDGAGSDDRDRINPIAIATFLRRRAAQPYASAFRAALPIVGVDGTLATLGKGTPSAGRIQAKPGNRVAFASPGVGSPEPQTWWVTSTQRVDARSSSPT